ncbi:MAG TPA: glycosyltransferase family 2 protein [Kineosporiaceae bacterium]|nr:glycosyltransferase family 2 protein [Kineosporiaceae bacterium]
MPPSNVVVVLPAYNAERTLARAVAAIPARYRAHLILVDDASSDSTYRRSVELGLTSIRHDRNRGYGGNQKTCYGAALDSGADIVVMLHPDGQYDARMIDALTLPIRLGICDIVLGNRIRSRRETLQGGMPRRKYLANRLLTGLENVLLGQNLGEFHSGMRAYSAQALRALPVESFSDDFSFDSQLLVSAAYFRMRIGDVPVPTIYTEDSSQIGMADSTSYALKTLLAVGRYLLQRAGLRSYPMFRPAAPLPQQQPAPAGDRPDDLLPAGRRAS